MRVEHKLEFAWIQFPQRSLDLLRQRRELVVHDQDPVRTRRNANVSAGAFKHVNIAGDWSCLDLDIRKIALGENRCGNKTRHGQEESGFHGLNVIQRHGVSPNLLAGRLPLAASVSGEESVCRSEFEDFPAIGKSSTLRDHQPQKMFDHGLQIGESRREMALWQG